LEAHNDSIDASVGRILSLGRGLSPTFSVFAITGVSCCFWKQLLWFVSFDAVMQIDSSVKRLAACECGFAHGHFKIAFKCQTRKSLANPETRCGKYINQ
jgi:acetone carboxylase gamma subunit